MTCDISSIIESGNIHHVYQPLWNLEQWKAFGYEAFIRTNTKLNPEELFQLARQQNQLFELDTLSIKKSISTFPAYLVEETYLFINIFPSTLLNDRFPQFIDELISFFPFIVGRVVFEINETKEEEHIWGTPTLNEKLDYLKETGFLFALDDVGKGAASLQKIIELKPEFLKLDRYFSVGLAQDKAKQRLLSLLVNYCHNRMLLIIEGIEESIDLTKAVHLKIPIAQGYLLGRPQEI